MPQAVRHVSRESRGDPQPQQPPGQRGHRHLPARAVQHHHRTRIDQPVHRQRNQPTCPARLAIRPHQSVGMLVGRDCSDTDHGPRGCPPDDLIGRHHRTPPIAKVLVRAISVACAIGRPWASDTHHMPLTCDFLFQCGVNGQMSQVTGMGVQVALGHQPFAHTWPTGRRPPAADYEPGRPHVLRLF
jgi:hypothetical protein